MKIALVVVAFFGVAGWHQQHVIVDAVPADEASCEEYCALFAQAKGRCPYAVESEPTDCLEDCLNAQLEEGTRQDFILTDTLQCRKNHALMAIKEGSLTNSNHCIHASLAGPERCVEDQVSTATAQEQAQGKQVFYYPTAVIGADPANTLLYLVAAIRFLIAKRGRLYTAYPNLDLGPSEGWCDGVDTRYRTADGTCNNQEMPLMGSQGTPFVHTTQSSEPHPNGYADVSKVAKILKRRRRNEADKMAPFNQLVSSWIQFMTHDWFAHDTTKSGPGLVNQVTHWWDASQLYGSTPDQENKIRVEGGKIHLDENDELDYDDFGVPLTGFTDNFWPGLHVMHTVFAREHNYIVDQLATEYPEMTDYEKFGAARNCIAAILAKIHTIEWTPTLLNNTVSTFGLNINWYGLKNTVYSIFDPAQIPPEYQAVIDNTKVASVGGEYGTDQTLFNTSFFMTEEFVSVYRMHPLLPDFLKVGERPNRKRIKLGDLAFSDARELVEDNTTKKFLQSLANTPARTLSLDNYPRQLYRLQIPGRDGVTNLAEVDITRDRERGLPRYNDARRQLLLEPYESIDDLTDDECERDQLKSVYTDIEQVDFMVGCLVDKERPEGFAFGVVPYYIFLVMASRRLFSDYFFQEGFTDENYTPWGMQYVAQTKFKNILDRHFPDLADGIPENPFTNDWK